MQQVISDEQLTERYATKYPSQVSVQTPLINQTERKLVYKDTLNRILA